MPNDVTQILNAINSGEDSATSELLPLVYEELRRLAALRMAQEKPGQTLQPTALVHEAYLKLVGRGRSNWEGRGHFLAAAAEAMRRILVDRARKKSRIKHGGDLVRVDINKLNLADESADEQVILVNEALEKLQKIDPVGAELVKLRFFVGCTNVQAAVMLNISERTAKRTWAYARAWLFEELKSQTEPKP